MKLEFIQPYAFDGKIGRAYNEAVEKCDDWICLTDQDTLKPPKFAERVLEVLQYQGEPERLFTCRTNRVGWEHPAVYKPMFMEPDIREHLSLAERLWNTHGRTLMDLHDRPAPGYCMVFHKSLWEKLGGWPEKTITFDKQLSKIAIPNVFLMKGIYIFHLYRWKHGKMAQHNIDHLRPCL